jgi:hypothetical protein
MLQAPLAYRFCSAIESGIVLSRRLHTRESVISVISFLDGLKYTDYEVGDLCRLRQSDGIKRMRHYFEGRAFDKSTVSSSGMAPVGTPFFCNRKAIMLMEFIAGTEFGAIIGISVCTLDHRVETFLPPYVCQNGLPTSNGPIPPSSVVP